MERDCRPADILHAAEQGLAALAAEAASKRDYVRAGKLLALAGTLADLGRRHSGADNNRPAKGGQPKSDPPTSAIGGPIMADKSAYPHFCQEGDALVKIGWSKSDRATYEHRSPRDVLINLAGMISDLGRQGQRFTTDTLLGMGADRLKDVPSYQIYLCLAFILQRGLVERHGRQGYTLPRPETVVADVDGAWAELPKR